MRRLLMIEIAVLAAVVAIGLGGAFVGLTTSSFWYDELFTSWVVGHDGDFGGMVGRLVQDVHPPLYYALAWLIAQVFGNTDLTLRLFSAIMGCAAIAAFLILPRKHFSLAARLAASAFAVSSPFWFKQTQNARDYTMALLVSVLMIVIAVRIVAELRASRPSRSTDYVALLGSGVLATLIHYYGMYTAVALCGMLFVIDRQKRFVAAAIATGIVAVGFAYLKIVIEPNTGYSTTEGWIPNTIDHYRAMTLVALRQAFRGAGWIAVVVSGIVMLLGPILLRSGRLTEGVEARPAASLGWLPRRIDPYLAVFVGTPALVWVMAVLSSQLKAPNFTDRNWLIAAPFFWATVARLFDIAAVRLGAGRLRLAFGAVVAALAIWSSSIVMVRDRQINQPFRAIAMAVKAEPKCAGAVIPTFYFRTFGWRRPGFQAEVQRYASQYYLGDYARADAVGAVEFMAGERPDVRAIIAARHRAGCPILAMAIHAVDEEEVTALADTLRAMAAAQNIEPDVQVRRIMIQSMWPGNRGLVPGGYLIETSRHARCLHSQDAGRSPALA